MQADDIQILPDELGKYIRATRISQKMAIRELARRARVSHSQVIAIENGTFRATVESYIRIVLALGLPPGVLLEACLRPGCAEFADAAIVESTVKCMIRKNKWDSCSEKLEAVWSAIGCCAANAVYLLRLQNMEETSKALTYPEPWMRKSWIAFACRIDAQFTAQMRANLVENFRTAPFSTLVLNDLCSESYVERRVAAAPGTPPHWCIAYETSTPSDRLLGYSLAPFLI